MHAVLSGFSQLAEALAADMIDPKHAHALLSVLRVASLNFRHPEKWQTNLYYSDQLGPAVDLAAKMVSHRTSASPPLTKPPSLGSGGSQSTDAVNTCL